MPPRRDAKTRTPASVKARALENEAFELRTGGATYRQIGEVQGVDTSTARQRVSRVLDRVQVEDIRTAKTIAADRIEWLWRRAAAAVNAAEKADQPGQVAACLNVAVRIHQRYCIFHGIEEPTRLEIAGQLQVEVTAEDHAREARQLAEQWVAQRQLAAVPALPPASGAD